jgi:hypothetical protein
MALQPQPLPQVPDATAAAVRAAFPKGNLYVDPALVRTSWVSVIFGDRGGSGLRNAVL